MSQYTAEELSCIYELGRMYYEMGYSGAAERIFGGLAALDWMTLPTQLALGLLKCERGETDEATVHIKAELDQGSYQLESKLALSGVFIAGGEISRARSLLAQIVKDHGPVDRFPSDYATLWRAFWLRCGGSLDSSS